MTKYKLMFNGQLIGDTKKDVCVKELSRIFKMKQEEIEKKLFSGKKTLIKTTTSRKEVDHYIDIFSKAGARLLIKQEIMGETSLTSIAPHQFNGNNLNQKRRKSLPVLKIVSIKSNNPNQDSLPEPVSGAPIASTIPKYWFLYLPSTCFYKIIYKFGYLFNWLKKIQAPWKMICISFICSFILFIFIFHFLF